MTITRRTALATVAAGIAAPLIASRPAQALGKDGTLRGVVYIHGPERTTVTLHWERGAEARTFAPGDRADQLNRLTKSL